ncbi:MAG TPA: hypothetical protein VIM51_02200 [Desulfosporosinus sp.]
MKLNPIIMMGASYYSLNEVVGDLFRTGLKLSESELVQLKLNIGASVGESTPTEAEIGTPT